MPTLLPKPAKPGRTYTSLDAAFDHFNAALFGDELPPCLITMQRHANAYGYFSGSRFADLDDPDLHTDEIALNPAHFAARTRTQTLSTLAHEMCHLWQHHFGKLSRPGYHNKEWAAKMHEIGLTPTSTGQPGGKETGQGVTHMIVEGGPFHRACAAFLATAPAVLYSDRAGDLLSPRRAADDDEGEPKPKAISKNKYSCTKCEQNAWAKPGANLICGDCRLPMVLVPSRQRST